MAERARAQRVEPIVRPGRRQEKPLDNLEQVGTEVPSPIRSTIDAEGQPFIPSKALESYPEAASAELVNMKLPIEDEEQVSTLDLPPFIKNYLSWLNADAWVISDSSTCAMEQPPLTHRLRGMSQIQVELLEPIEKGLVRRGHGDLHLGNVCLARDDFGSRLERGEARNATLGAREHDVYRQRQMRDPAAGIGRGDGLMDDGRRLRRRGNGLSV